MPGGRKKMFPPRKQHVKRLLDGISPKKSSKTATTQTVVEDTMDDDIQRQLSSDEVTPSSSRLKGHEDVIEKDLGTSSPNPTLGGQQSQGQQHGERARQGAREPVTANSDFFYTPIYRRYFGITPPNPRLNNPRLLEDYIDWYMNVYIEEEMPWQYLNTGNPADRDKRDEQEAREEYERYVSAASSFPPDQ